MVREHRIEHEATADTMNHFLQHCIFPRCVFSPADAVYCARFVQQTHAQGTPFFSTLQYYDKLLRDISLHIFCCTERQAANLGRFLKESPAARALEGSEQIYLEECSKLPGFRVIRKPGRQEGHLRGLCQGACAQLLRSARARARFSVRLRAMMTPTRVCHITITLARKRVVQNAFELS